MKTPAFLISRVPLLPGEPAVCPEGDVLHVAFDRGEAFAWVKHPVVPTATMQLVPVPTGGPLEFEVDAGFAEPFHVGSMVQPGQQPKLQGMNHKPRLGSCWHVFCWKSLPTVTFQ